MAMRDVVGTMMVFESTNAAPAVLSVVLMPDTVPA